MEKKERGLLSYFFLSALLYFLADCAYLLLGMVVIFPMLLFGSFGLLLLTTAVYVFGIIAGSIYIVKRTDNVFIYPAGVLLVEGISSVYEAVKCVFEDFADNENIIDVIKEYRFDLYNDLGVFAFSLAVAAVIKYLLNRKKKTE